MGIGILKLKMHFTQ